MRTVPQLYEVLASALTELANSHGVRLDVISVDWMETSSAMVDNEFQVRRLEIRDGGMYHVIDRWVLAKDEKR